MRCRTMRSKFCGNKYFSVDVIVDFDLIEKGFVGRPNVPPFTTCLIPMFRDRASGFGMINRRQERVNNVLRIENVSVSLSLIVSADIHDNGIVEIYPEIADN